MAKAKGKGRVRPALKQAWQRLRGGDLTPWRAALSVGIGLCIGMLPLYGVHWALVLAICLPLRLDVRIAYLAANISVPFIAPFLMLAEVQAGSLVMTGALLPLTVKGMLAIGVSGYIAELVIGTVLLAPATGLFGGGITYVLVRLKRGWRSAPKVTTPAEKDGAKDAAKDDAKEQPLGT